MDRGDKVIVRILIRQANGSIKNEWYYGYIRIAKHDDAWVDWIWSDGEEYTSTFPWKQIYKPT